MEQMRLNKYLAHCGICSRRDADKLIASGKVLINGRVAQPGCQCMEEDEVMVCGRQIEGINKTVVLAFYKPVGVTCTERDVHAEKIIADFVKYPVRLTYAGRLDKDSEGLLLLTNDGNLIQEMMRGKNRHEKEYLVRVDKEVTLDFLKKMSQGIYLEELGVVTEKCRAEKAGKYTFRLILTQGLNRQIKRMCMACGYRVRNLKRIRVMHIGLGDMKPGEYYELSEADVRRLYRDCGISHQGKKA